MATLHTRTRERQHIMTQRVRAVESFRQAVTLQCLNLWNSTTLPDLCVATLGHPHLLMVIAAEESDAIAQLL